MLREEHILSILSDQVTEVSKGSRGFLEGSELHVQHPICSIPDLKTSFNKFVQ